MWCRAFNGTHLTPPVLRAMRIREVATLFGADIAPPPPRMVIPETEARASRPGGPRLREVD